MDERDTKLALDVPMDNVSNNSPQCESENACDYPSCHASSSPNDPHEQPLQGNQTGPAQGSPSQPLSQREHAADSFEGMLEELRSETPPFHPFPSDNRACDWFTACSANEELLSAENTGVQKTLDELSKVMEQTIATPNTIPDGSQAELTKPSGTSSKAGTNMDSENIMGTEESSSEDPLAFGSLQIPIVDQYPCFQASPDGDSIEVDDDVFKTFCGGTDDSMDCNIVTVGTFLELDDLPKLKQENLPKPAPEHVIENPLSVSSLYKRFSNLVNKEFQENESSLKQKTVDKVDSNDLARVTHEAKIAPKTSCQGDLNVQKKPPKSVSDETHIAPRTTAVTASATNMHSGVTEREYHVLENAISNSRDGILDPEALSLSQMEGRYNQPFTRQLSSPLLSEEATHRLTNSPVEMVSGKQSSNLQVMGNPRSTLSEQGGNGVYAQGALPGPQPNLLLRKKSHVSSNHRQSPSVGNLGSSRGNARMNLSLPIQPHCHPNVVLKGHPLVTPTSIMCPEVPFPFQNNPQQVSNLEFHSRVKNTSFDVHQMSMTGNAAWGKSTADNKRRICEVGSAYQTATKKSRTASSNPKARQDVRRNTEETSRLSRHVQTQQVLYQSPNMSSSTHPVTSASKTTGTVCGLTQHFGPGMQLPPGEGPARSSQGQASEATVASPSHPRSTNVREERGQLVKRFVCSDCPEAYAFKENCERHYKVIHQGRTVYFCFHCPASYLQSKTMRCHVDKKHFIEDGENSVFPCYWCEFKTNTEMSWTKHVSEMHPGYRNSFRGNSG